MLDDTTADFAWTLLLATARRLVESDTFFRSGKWKGWGLMQFTGYDVHHKTLGIVGMGRIGKGVARRAKGFDMRVIYTDIQRADEATEREADLIICGLPFRRRFGGDFTVGRTIPYILKNAPCAVWVIREAMPEEQA